MPASQPRPRHLPPECEKKHAWAEPDDEWTECTRCHRIRVFIGYTAPDGRSEAPRVGRRRPRSSKPKRRYKYLWIYPQDPGTRVRLVAWYPDDHEEIPAGTLGTVIETDRVTGVVMVAWDGHGKLGVIPGYDEMEEAALHGAEDRHRLGKGRGRAPEADRTGEEGDREGQPGPVLPAGVLR